ncbi:Os04g0642200 [Oryza sativa Japonica Group]|uniref:Os04g0642200 protein n=1 Tax=Oryza sativa subsp. japonica TaxID=39947 RepID=A0A0P0WFD1_ORYSJ|nr:Os04g0642200 [Oryza sativa Japonica Group]
MAMTLRFPAGGATSVPAAMPHRVPMATAPSRLPATVAMALVSLRYPGLECSVNPPILFRHHHHLISAEFVTRFRFGEADFDSFRGHPPYPDQLGHPLRRVAPARAQD